MLGGDSLWQDAFAAPALSHCLSVCATTINNPLVARKACIGSSWCVSSLPSGEETGGFDVVRMGSTFWPGDPSVPSGPRCQAVLCKNYLQWKKHFVRPSKLPELFYFKKKEKYNPKDQIPDLEMEKTKTKKSQKPALCILFLFNSRQRTGSGMQPVCLLIWS